MAKHAREITHEELIMLTQFANCDDVFTHNRASAILLSAKGKRTSEVADAVGVSERYVRKVIHSFNKYGMQVMHKGRISGRPCIFTELHREALVELLKKHPQDFGINQNR